LDAARDDCFARLRGLCFDKKIEGEDGEFIEKTDRKNRGVEMRGILEILKKGSKRKGDTSFEKTRFGYRAKVRQGSGFRHGQGEGARTTWEVTEKEEYGGAKDRRSAFHKRESAPAAERSQSKREAGRKNTETD